MRSIKKYFHVPKLSWYRNGTTKYKRDIFFGEFRNNIIYVHIVGRFNIIHGDYVMCGDWIDSGFSGDSKFVSRKT